MRTRPTEQEPVYLDSIHAILHDPLNQSRSIDGIIVVVASHHDEHVIPALTSVLDASRDTRANAGSRLIQ